MKLFRALERTEETEFQQWARDNYQPHTPINGTWHPIAQAECVKINVAAERTPP